MPPKELKGQIEIDGRDYFIGVDMAEDNGDYSVIEWLPVSPIPDHLVECQTWIIEQIKKAFGKLYASSK